MDLSFNLRDRSKKISREYFDLQEADPQAESEARTAD